MKTRTVGGGGAGGDGASMFARSLKIGRLEEQEQQEQEQQEQQHPPMSPHRLVATPITQNGASIDPNDRLLLLQETVRSRIAAACPPILPLAVNGVSHTAASAASATSLPLGETVNPFDVNAIDDADQLIMKLHLSSSSAVRAKTLRDLTGNFFPKALEVGRVKSGVRVVKCC